MTIGKLKCRKGFTLVEIMIAVFLLTIALIGLVSLTVTIINGNDFSRRMTTAATLAKDKMEEVKNRSYNDLTAGTTTDYLNIDSSVGSAGAYFTRIMTVTADTPAVNMKRIEVWVRWNWGSITREVKLETTIGA